MNRSVPIGRDVPLFPNDVRVVRLREENACSLLTDEVFGPYPTHVQAVGFKSFDNQARRGHVQHVWDLLAAYKEIAIIHLARRNLPSTCLYKVTALRSGHWVQHGPRRLGLGPVRLDPYECRQ